MKSNLRYYIYVVESIIWTPYVEIDCTCIDFINRVVSNKVSITEACLSCKINLIKTTGLIDGLFNWW